MGTKATAPMKRFAREIAPLAYFIAVSSLTGASCPQIAPATEPAWIDLISNNFSSFGTPGTSLLFNDLNSDVRTPGQQLPLAFEVPPSAIGAIDTHTYPATGPVFYSNASGASIDCLPGIDPSLPNGCPDGQVGVGCPASGDCTGHPIQRSPAVGIVSSFTTRTAGISYLGTFEGTANADPGGVLEVVFFHQKEDYVAGNEYGFYRDPTVPNLLTVYWQTNANCSLRPFGSINDTMCTTREAVREASTYIYTDNLVPGAVAPPITTTCTIDLSSAGGFGLYYYSMWIFSDDGTLKFGMSIRDPNTMLPVVPDTSIDPNVGISPDWYPIGPLNGGDGYVTAGITRFDPLENQTFSSPPPTMSMERLEVAKAPPNGPRRR